jgi:hypothetical protein
MDLPDTDVDDVLDETENETISVKNFQIDSYGADYTVDGLVTRMKSGAFFVPPFQRSYVWNHKQASRFIESLLLGLPVPGVFVFKDEESGKHLIVDGQQRLKTLQFFYTGVFAEGRVKDRAFRLVDVREPWNEKKYGDLDEPDRLRLDDSIIHTIIFKQREPSNDDQSVYEVFERINTTGVKLSDQEVRTCVNFGAFYELLKRLNDTASWRKIYGPKSERLKDQELILRFLAILHDVERYERPMKGFLNKFMKKYSKSAELAKMDFETEFVSTIDTVARIFGDRVFRPERQINAAVFDAIMVGLARRQKVRPLNDVEGARVRYDELLKSEEFQGAYLRSTANTESVQRRISMATAAFKTVE